MTTKAKTIKPAKKAAVKTIKEKIDTSNIMILTDFRGMTVKQVTELRKKLRGHKAEYRVFKNTLVVKALPEGMASLKDQLTGPVAIVFGFDDIVMPAKELVKFIHDNEKPRLIGSVIEKQVCGEKEVNQLSKLPSRQELLSKVVGGLKAPLYNLVSVLHGPLRKFVYALDAVKKQKENTGPSTSSGQGGEK